MGGATLEIKGCRYPVSGISLNAVVQGDGPPVLLLHGFPDSVVLWRHQIPALVEAGYRVIAYDQRGYGNSDAPEGAEHYGIEVIVQDAIGLLDELGVREKVRVVGHDWGAVIGWFLAMRHPDRVERLVALSVGHPNAYAAAGLEQKLRAWYAVAFQVRGLAEAAVRARNFALLRHTTKHHPENDRWIADLSRPGRLTAGLNWYRANLRLLMRGNHPAVRVPVLGIWSTGDGALTEEQMVNSRRYVEGGWHYQRLQGVGHWMPVDAPERLNELLISEFR